MIMKKKFNLHLVSDGSCSTLNHFAKAALSQLSELEPKKHMWLMIKDEAALEKCLQSIEKKPGVVLYTIFDPHLRDRLKDFCRKLKVPCIGILGKFIKEMCGYFGVEVGETHETNRLDSDYYDKVEAIEYTLNHDDGQKYQNLEEADIVLVGVSRTSKSPTCVYLAYNGYKAANIPFVSGHNLPDILFKLEKPMVIGLTIDPEHLMEIRKHRLLSLNQSEMTEYTDTEKIIDECREARKIFSRNGWPVIDITSRSIEETSATIIKLYIKRQKKLGYKLSFSAH
jgi:regulator of PEP synthase PpsR (kinase-PPPase family)